jgi:hypothetical protein
VLDDFFQLGGHSLLMTRVVIRLRAAFELAVPLGLMFERCTVAASAAWLRDELLAQVAAMSEDEAQRRVGPA